MGSFSDDQASLKSTDDLPGSRVKFLCSHGGKILPKSDGQLRYVGGDTRLVSIKKNIGFAELMGKLERLFGSNLWLKYQLPNEDLDALISVTCDEDVENLIDEYDKNESRDGGSRLRAFLFPRVAIGVISSSDQPVDETKSSCDLQSIGCPRAQPNIRSASSIAFHVPDYLFGLDHAAHDYQQQDWDSRSPKHSTTPIDKGSFLIPPVRSLKDPPTQADYTRQQSSRMDSGGRGPALTTSASNHQLSWEIQKLRDVGVPGDQRDEKGPVDISGEPHFNKSQRDAGTETAMHRIPSKDRIVPIFVEGSHADTHLIADGQGRLQSILNLENLKLEDVNINISGGPLDASGSRFCETQRGIPQLSLGVAAACELQWGLPQPTAPGFDAAAERPSESCRNSGDSENGIHRRLEGPLVVENAGHTHPFSTMVEGPADGLKFQDDIDAHKGEEMKVYQHLHQQQFHHAGKSHFQQVHTQSRDMPEDQQHRTFLHEPVWTAHSAQVMQRPVQLLNSHLTSSGSTGHHHRVPSGQSNVRTMPRSDSISGHRLPSPLYRHLAIAGTLQPDSQQLSRAPSPLQEHPSGNGPLISSRYGHRIVQFHEVGYMPSAIAQQNGLPVPQVYMDPIEGHSLYDQSGAQLHYVEKGTMGNHNTNTGQAKYPDKIMTTHHDGAISQVNYSDDKLQTSQYMRMSNNHNNQGVPLRQDTSATHSHQ